MGVFNREYLRRCLDSLGGLDEVYLFGYIPYTRQNIQIYNGELRGFPSNTLYRVEGLKNANYTETTSFNEQGEQFEQSLNLSFSKADDYYNFMPLVKSYVRALVKDRNGSLRLLGCYNGMSTSGYNKQSGTSRGELSGYNITLQGMESTEAPYVSSTEVIQSHYSTFINLSSSGIFWNDASVTLSTTEILS